MFHSKGARDPWVLATGSRLTTTKAATRRPLWITLTRPIGVSERSESSRSIYLSIHLSIHLSIYLSFHLIWDMHMRMWNVAANVCIECGNDGRQEAPECKNHERACVTRGKFYNFWRIYLSVYLSIYLSIYLSDLGHAHGDTCTCSERLPTLWRRCS